LKTGTGGGGGGGGAGGAKRSVSFGEDRVLELGADPADADGSASVGAAGDDGEGSAAGELDELEDGWEVNVSQSTGHTYYTHLATGTNQWDKPLSEVAKQKRQQLLHQQQQQQQGDIGSVGNHKDGKEGKGKGMELPEPWEERISTSSQRIYYFNPLTGDSVWQRPTSTATTPTLSAEDKTDGEEGEQEGDSDSKSVGRRRRSGGGGGGGMFACCAAPATDPKAAT
jgi:hypothetical protein